MAARATVGVGGLAPAAEDADDAGEAPSRGVLGGQLGKLRAGRWPPRLEQQGGRDGTERLDGSDSGCGVLDRRANGRCLGGREFRYDECSRD